MQFKQCKYYEKSIERENCPLACVCRTECYFTLKQINNELLDYKRKYELLCDEFEREGYVVDI